jgi:succinate dehydrogenase / fumarate reductase flavoprotein subunit
MAMGGINAVMDFDNDSYLDHYRDTMRSGYDLNNKNAVMSMVTNVPRIIVWLKYIGTNFNTEDDGRISLRKFGGQKNKRTIYAGNSTGKQIMTAIINEARKKETEGKIIVKKGIKLLSLLMNDTNQECMGACFYSDDKRTINIYADMTIIATGGPNGVFGRTTGSTLNTGCVDGILLKQGVEFENLEMIQFHPTTIDAVSKRIVISESARGMGGSLYTIKNGKLWYFMKEWYPEMGELMARDVVCKSIYKVCDELGYKVNHKKGVFLDLTHINKDVIDTKLVEVKRTCKKYLGVDISTEPIVVYPEIHYFMGGIKTDEQHRTNIKRLYAIGECSSQYHGAGRLGGNSLLGALNGAFVVGNQSILINIVPENTKFSEVAYMKDITDEHTNKNVQEFIRTTDEKASFIMKESMGIVRDENSLSNALKQIQELRSECEEIEHSNFYEYYTLINKLMISEAFIISALTRKESRGAHCRRDFPVMMKEAKSTVITYKNNRIEVRLE